MRAKTVCYVAMTVLVLPSVYARDDDFRNKRAEQRFSELDGDGDGFISEAEFFDGKVGSAGVGSQAAKEALRRQRFAQLDSDNDHKISQEEFMAQKRGPRRYKESQGKPAGPPAKGSNF